MDAISKITIVVGGILISSGDIVLLDDQSIEKINFTSWHKDSRGYAYCHSLKNGVDRPIRMHRLLMLVPDGYDVDHINGNRLDNRISNLRICSRRENIWNSKIKKNNSSGFKGVDFVKSRNLFRARIRTLSGRINLGYFKTAEEAAEKYAAAAKYHHENFAKT